MRGSAPRVSRPEAAHTSNAARLGRQVARRLAECRQTLALAEASSGGALADALTAAPGASAFFLGGVVAYSNTSKEAVLGVPRALLERHGAVSSEVAGALARGARRLFGSDLGLAVSGILGPGGATPAKPVGLTFIALDGPAGLRVEQHLFQGDRASNKAASVEAALRLLWAALANEP